MTRWNGRIQAGWILIAVGALFLVERLGWDWGWSWHPTVRRLWPVILIVVGLAKMQSNVADPGTSGWRLRRQVAGGGWIVLMGILFLLDQNGWLYLSQSWPLFVIGAGLSLLLSRHRADREGT